MLSCRRPKSVTRLSAPSSGAVFPDRSAHDVEEVAADAVLDFDNPKIGVKLRLPRQIVFDIRVGCGLRSQARRKNAIRGTRLKRALRGGSKQLRRSIQPADAHENRTGFFGAAPTHDSRTTFDLAAPQIGRNPQGTFEAHCLRSFLRSGFSSIPTVLASGRFSGNDHGRFPAHSPPTIYSIGCPTIQVSSLTKRSETRPLFGKLWSRSNIAIAALVASSNIPETLTWP